MTSVHGISIFRRVLPQLGDDIKACHPDKHHQCLSLANQWICRPLIGRGVFRLIWLTRPSCDSSLGVRNTRGWPPNNQNKTLPTSPEFFYWSWGDIETSTCFLLTINNYMHSFIIPSSLSLARSSVKYTQPAFNNRLLCLIESPQLYHLSQDQQCLDLCSFPVIEWGLLTFKPDCQHVWSAQA